MKRHTIIFVVIFLLTACDRASSPDGRSQMRDEKLEKEIDSLRSQVDTLHNRINLIDQKLKHSKNKGL
jgi:hypothetical protein